MSESFTMRFQIYIRLFKMSLKADKSSANVYAYLAIQWHL